MANNDLKAIKATYFDYLVNLEDISLADNSKLNVIELGSFKNLSELKCLDLTRCDIN